jgi:NADH:ubiquinone oxidoreductase subunit 2 (subunit N)
MNISAILPEVVLAIGAALVMTIDAMTGGRRNIGWLAALTVMVAGGVVISQFNQIEAGFDGMVLADRFAHLMRLVIYLGTLLALLTAIGAWNARGSSSVFGAEHYGLLLIAVVGMDLLVLSADMTILFLGLEILSIPLYGMAAGRLGSDRSVEAGAKYFLNGAFASGFVLFGIALVYGRPAHSPMNRLAARCCWMAMPRRRCGGSADCSSRSASSSRSPRRRFMRGRPTSTRVRRLRLWHSSRPLPRLRRSACSYG